MPFEGGVDSAQARPGSYPLCHGQELCVHVLMCVIVCVCLFVRACVLS